MATVGKSTKRKPQKHARSSLFSCSPTVDQHAALRAAAAASARLGPSRAMHAAIDRTLHPPTRPSGCGRRTRHPPAAVIETPRFAARTHSVCRRAENVVRGRAIGQRGLNANQNSQNQEPGDAEGAASGWHCRRERRKDGEMPRAAPRSTKPPLRRSSICAHPGPTRAASWGWSGPRVRGGAFEAQDAMSHRAHKPCSSLLLWCRPKVPKNRHCMRKFAF